jgi:hypothetical protein
VRVWPVSKVPPPVLGFNNNVRHRGRIFHIQTEDSGVKFSRVVTHLFADGGRIIKTAKTDYTEHSAKPDVSAIVRGIMKEQHRAMFTALRGGGLDALLERAIGPLSEVPAKRVSRPPAPSARQSVRPKPARESTPPPPARRRSLSNPALQGVAQAVEPPAAAEFELDVATLEALPQPSRSQPPAAARPRKSAVPPPRRSRPPQPRPAPQPQRPAAQFASAPEARARSIFGDEAISEQTLDEVILSYLAEDLDGSQE